MKRQLILSAGWIAALTATALAGSVAAQNTSASQSPVNPITNGAIFPGPGATFVPGVGLVPNTPTVGNGRILPNLLEQGSILPNLFDINTGGNGKSQFDPYGLVSTVPNEIDPFGLTSSTTGIPTNSNFGSADGNSSFPATFGTANPTVGSGYFGGYPGYGYGGYGGFGTIIGTSGLFQAMENQSLVHPPVNGGIVPTLGINVPAGSLAARNGYRRVGGGGSMRRISENDTGVQERVAGSRQETRSAESPEQVALVEDLQDVMSDRPLREGTVVKVGATSVQVRIRDKEEVQISRVPVGQVFFFQKNGKLASAATHPNLVHKGDRVMVPDTLVHSHPVSIRDRRKAMSARAAIRKEVQDRVRDGETLASEAIVISPSPAGEQVASNR